MTGRCAHTLSWVVVQRVEWPDGTRILQESCPDCCKVLSKRPVPTVEVGE